jgi:hypothetical protein
VSLLSPLNQNCSSVFLSLLEPRLTSLKPILQATYYYKFFPFGFGCYFLISTQIMEFCQDTIECVCVSLETDIRKHKMTCQYWQCWLWSFVFKVYTL